MAKDKTKKENKMSIKINFMHHMKWTRVMLPVLFQKFEPVCIFLRFFSFYYYCQEVNSRKNLERGAALLNPNPPGFYEPVFYWK